MLNRDPVRIGDIVEVNAPNSIFYGAVGTVIEIGTSSCVIKVNASLEVTIPVDRLKYISKEDLISLKIKYLEEKFKNRKIKLIEEDEISVDWDEEDVDDDYYYDDPSQEYEPPDD